MEITLSEHPCFMPNSCSPFRFLSKVKNLITSKSKTKKEPFTLTSTENSKRTSCNRKNSKFNQWEGLTHAIISWQGFTDAYRVREEKDRQNAWMQKSFTTQWAHRRSRRWMSLCQGVYLCLSGQWLHVLQRGSWNLVFLLWGGFVLHISVLGLHVTSS